MVEVAPTAKPTDGEDDESTPKAPTLFTRIRLFDEESWICRRLPEYLFNIPEPRSVSTLAAEEVASNVTKSAESNGAVVVPANMVGAWARIWAPERFKFWIEAPTFKAAPLL